MDDDKLIVLASDHNGVRLKRHVISTLSGKGYKCIDIGPYVDNISSDYVDYATQLGQIIHNGDVPRGILICGTGVGMSIAANRFKNVRAALIHNLDCASKCREHNNSNVLCLGSWISTPIAVDQILDQWIETSFGEGRHVKRIEKMSGQNKPETIVFTNGCFDILHVGHVQTLEFAKSLGGKLIVAINSDRSVREIKGYDRPINGENDRKKILESMSAVDEVVIFGETEPNKIMLQSQPDIVVKGGDYTVAELRERDSIPDHIDIKTAPLINKELYSTTTVVDKIRNNA